MDLILEPPTPMVVVVVFEIMRYLETKNPST